LSDRGKRYNQEFKCETAKLIVDKGRSVPSVAADMGITEQTLYRWVNQYRKDTTNAFPGSGKLKPSDEEIRQMKRRIADLEEENAILKKAAAIFINHRK
jgi:transposase